MCSAIISVKKVVLLHSLSNITGKHRNHGLLEVAIQQLCGPKFDHETDSQKSDLHQTLHALCYDIDQRFPTHEGEFRPHLDVVLVKIRDRRSGRKFIKIINLAIMCSAIISVTNMYYNRYYTSYGVSTCRKQTSGLSTALTNVFKKTGGFTVGGRGFNRGLGFNGSLAGPLNGQKLGSDPTKYWQKREMDQMCMFCR